MPANLIAIVLALFGAGAPGGAAPPPAPAPTAKPAAAPTGKPAPAPAGARDAERIVDAVQKFYQDTPQFSAKFRQTVLSGTFGKTTLSDGQVYLKKPGKMRWDYVSKRNKSITRSQMSDGNTIWVVLVQNKQYFEQSLTNSALPVAVTFLTGKGNLKLDFNVALDSTGKFGSKTDRVLHLTPKKPSAQFKDLYLIVDPENYRVKQSVVINSGGDVNKFEFFEPDTAKRVADTWFVFNPKAPAAKGFRRIEPPKEGAQ
ncbi:MAG TPA: outer membrane lipoprotein carrier protein LolA [Kofleriaceae bacterium]|nr:outer membrane lipoprotein carrier protein LolA [Kofleriaceae bacterium]